MSWITPTDGQQSTGKRAILRTSSFQLARPFRLLQRLLQFGGCYLAVRRVEQPGTRLGEWLLSDGLDSGILDHALTGVRPKWKGHQKSKREKRKKLSYKQIAPEVVRRPDIDGQSFDEIARDLGCGQSTVRRAYDHVRPEAARSAADSGTKPDRGRYFLLGTKAYDRIRTLLLENKKADSIANAVSCSVTTVRRVQRMLVDEGLL